MSLVSLIIYSLFYLRNMPKPILLLLFLAATIAGQCQVAEHHNIIDDAKTDKDVMKIIKGCLRKNSKGFSFKHALIFTEETRKAAAPLIQNPWTKTDFDNNGYTDLLVIERSTDNRGRFANDGRNIFCIMDSGHNHLYIRKLARGHSGGVYARSTIMDNAPVVLWYNYVASDSDPGGRRMSVDTLVFKFGEFVERYKSPVTHAITSIQLDAIEGLHALPYSITVQSDGIASYHPILNNLDNTLQNTNKLIMLRINDSIFYRLASLLNYIGFENIDLRTINDINHRNWFDAGDCTLTITYDGGKIKEIHDYGMDGSFALRHLYRIFSDLKDNQNWH